MKTKISHLGRSTVSVILAVMMLLSTMLIGTVSTVNATVNDAIKVYFDKSSCSDNGNTSTDGWTNIYAYAYDNKGDVKTYTNSADVTGKGSWPGQAMYDEGNNIYSILVEPTATSIIFNNNDNSNKKQTGNITLPAEDTLNWKTTSVIYKNNTWVSYSASVDTTGVVTDTRLVSVLDGSKVMFYGGEDVEWKQDYFVAMNTKDTNDVADSAKTDYEKQLTKKDSTSASTFKFGILCVPAGTYYMGHKGWAPNLKANVVAGDAFVIYNSEINDFTKVAQDGNNLLLQSVSTGTKTATTTLSSNEVATGDLLGVTTSTSAGSSSLGFANTFEYYVLNKTTNKFYKVALSEGKLDTSVFTDEGEYEVKTVLKDTNGLYVLADSDNFVISNKAKYSVTFGSNDTNMGKVSVSDGTNSYTTSPASVEEGKEVTFTATANEGYKFDGWYSDAECKNQIDGASNATYTVNNISQAVSAYAKFSALSYNITTETVTNYSVEVNESAEYNSPVSVTVTATDNAYEVNGITVTDKDNNVVNVSGGESGVYTFTMPASNVTVKANSKLKQIGAPTVTFNVLGQSTADAQVLDSTVITAGYTVAENSTIVEGSENVAVTNADGAEVSADKYNLEKNTTTGSYTFTAKEPGTYKLSYTVTAKSDYDENMTATNSPVSVTITVAYTATQQAYVALENYVNSVKDTSAGSYTEDSFADFSTALKSAQALLKGLPDADATNTDDYTTALTNLTNARNNLKSNKQYYILGHSAITGGTDTSSATSHDNGIPMKDNGNGDYTYTFSSSDIKSGNDAFCFIDNSDHIYKTGSGASINITDSQYTADNPYTVDILSANQGLYYIGNPTTSKRYTIHLNTATDGKIKVWIEEPPLAYGLQGAVYASQSDSSSIGWSNYSETMSFNADNNYTLKFYAKNSNQTNNQFRLIDSAKINYGSDNPSGLKVALNTDYTTKKASGNVYYVEKSDKPYTIRLTNPGKNPPEFIVTQGAQHSVTVDPDIANGKISVDKNNPYEGDTVTVEATPVSGYVLETVTFNNTPAKVVGNKATFTMPNEDVTVTAAFRTANKYKVTIASDITNGTVTANGSSKTVTVTEGAPVTLVAVPDSSYSFSSWSITPESGYTAEGSMTSATATIYPTADITVSASFAQGTASKDHFLAWGNGEEIKNWTNGISTYSSTDNKVYTAYLNPSYFEENKWYYFAVTNKIPSSGNGLNNNDLYYNTSDITVNDSKSYQAGDNLKTERKENNGNYFGAFQYSGELVSLSISYNEGTKNYQVTPVVKVHNGAKLYAKNGSCRTDKQYANNMHTKGITTISYDKTKYDVDVDTKSSSSWQIAYLSEENIKNEVKLTITTKVKDSEYYLAGWCVDGETYLPKTSNMESNEYSFDYYVKSTTKLTDTIEVTPVYFYKTSADTETVRFYVTGFDDTVKKDWGNTIAVYPYYSGGTSGDVFSNYPGQPMLVSGGRCYVDLPIKYKGGTIAGVTLNNYFYDDVHNGLVSSLGNRQTYDYNDFLKIYEQKISGSTERKSQEIIFSFKYVPSGTSGYNNFGDDSTGKGDKTSVTYPDTISADVMDTLYANGWEDLTDFYGNKVDLYNQKVDASSVDGKKNPWRVISNGYEQTYFGYYATRWAVYKPDVNTGSVTEYSLVDVISSSSLLYNNYADILADTKTYSAGDEKLSASSDAEAYKAFKDAGADGVPVKITYEQTVKSNNSIEGEPNKNEDAYRNDGRWYYSEDNLNVTAHTVIEYADTLDAFSGTLGTDFRRDYYQDGEVDYTKDGYDSSKYTGLTTGTSAYFTNDEYYKKTEAKGQTGSGNTFNIIANTDHASEYIFVGWYLLSEGKYSPLTSTVENSVSVTQDNNDVYVARFIKAPSGSLTISHKLHPNTTGLGECYVSVDVLDKTDNVIHSYDETTSDITVSNAYITYGQGNKIKITLRTVPGEATTFTDFYSYSYSTDFIKLVNTETGAVPAVTVAKDASTNTYKADISFNVDDYLFDKDLTDHQQKIKVLNYFSQLSLGSVKYEIKYTFDTRLYGTKVYKVSGTLTADDISKYGCTETKLSESFVMAKAPFESNFKQNITWDSNQIKFGSKADGTLTADITATQVDDRNVTATFHVVSDSPAEDITTNFGNRFFKDGSYISAKDTGTTADIEGLPEAYKDKNGDFSFWYVMTKNKEFVTKAYGQNFAYTGYDNYIVVAVYGVGGTHKDESTDSSINFLQYSRNHWNDTVSGKDDTGSYSLAGTDYDRLYADFNLMFNHNGLLLNNYSGNDIKVGYAMVVGSKKDGNYTVNQEELKTAISNKATDGGSVEHQSTSATASKAVTVTDSDNVVAKKNVIVNSIRIADLDNKNRITSYYGFKNSEANQSYYVQVYSYVIVDNNVTLSETPVVINLNDIGNKTYVPQQ
uniref:InlB B-repeat-containing protein n=1 Tax=Ruminococcus bromii TaxID=40518 RepID=UPI00402556EB